MTEMTLRWMEWWCDCCDFGPEWRNDGWMKLISKLRDSACFQKYTSFHPHSVSRAPFLSPKTAPNEVKMSELTLKWYITIVFFIPWYLRQSEMSKEWRNEVEWRRFWRDGKKSTTKFLSICYHSTHSGVIQLSQCHSYPTDYSAKLFSIIVEWHWNEQEWPLNERIGCCLYIETTSYSFTPTSSGSFKSHSASWVSF